MPTFACIPIPTEIAERFRRTGIDDNGNKLRRMVVTPEGGFPCRHCLRLGRPGETMLLGSFNLPRPLGIYWTPSPIFLHEAECEQANEPGEVAEIIRRNPLISVRAYNAEDQCLYDLGHVGPGETIDEPLTRALSDPRTAFVNVHTARPGCLLSRVERIAA